MRKIYTLSVFVVLAFAVSFSAHEVYAVLPPCVSALCVSPNPVQVDGFMTVYSATPGPYTPGQEVYVFIDGRNVDHQFVAGDGSISMSFTLPPPPPPGFGPGTYDVVISSDPNNIIPLSDPVSLTVNPNPTIPEFPFPFSLVIIFVAVAAVYMGMRQKMTTNFKRF